MHRCALTLLFSYLNSYENLRPFKWWENNNFYEFNEIMINVFQGLNHLHINVIQLLKVNFD